MQKPVAVTLRSKGSSLYLLHHHYEHNQEDGECRTDDAYRTDDGVLSQLCNCLCDILFYHDVVLSF